MFPDGLMVSKENGYFERGNTLIDGIVATVFQQLRRFHRNGVPRKQIWSGREDLNLRPPGPELSQYKLQVLHLVSLREQNTTFSLAQLYRTCTDLPTLTGDDDGYDDNVEVVKKNRGKKK